MNNFTLTRRITCTVQNKWQDSFQSRAIKRILSRRYDSERNKPQRVVPRHPDRLQVFCRTESKPKYWSNCQMINPPNERQRIKFWYLSWQSYRYEDVLHETLTPWRAMSQRNEAGTCTLKLILFVTHRLDRYPVRCDRQACVPSTPGMQEQKSKLRITERFNQTFLSVI